jgi:hypothetical protein
MEWVKPIDEVEADFRRQGVFMLVDVWNNKLLFFGYKKNNVDINRLIASLRGRSKEMGKFLLARAKGETK